jgi:hypothetical protein
MHGTDFRPVIDCSKVCRSIGGKTLRNERRPFDGERSQKIDPPGSGSQVLGVRISNTQRGTSHSARSLGCMRNAELYGHEIVRDIQQTSSNCEDALSRWIMIPFWLFLRLYSQGILTISGITESQKNTLLYMMINKFVQCPRSRPLLILHRI